MGNCKTCKHNNGMAVVAKGEEPCFSCLTSKEEYPNYELDAPRVTNADRIRAMSDYELAEWLADILNHCDAKPPTADCLESCPLYKCCNDQPSDNIEDWLKSPAEDGEQNG